MKVSFFHILTRFQIHARFQTRTCFQAQALLLAAILSYSNTPAIAQTPASTEQATQNIEKPLSSDNNIYQFANGCYVMQLAENGASLTKNDKSYAFSNNTENNIAAFTMRPAALGIYLFYDQGKNYLISDNKQLSSANTLISEMKLDMPETDYLITPGEWELQSSQVANHYYLKNIKNQSWLSSSGLNADKKLAAEITFKASTGCAKFPESETGTTGKISKTQFDDGTLFGFIDAHEHSGANQGFGGKIFHGASFHKLGIEHALADCEKHHGENGSKDLMNIAYKGGSGNIKTTTLLTNLYEHLVQDKPDHHTDGYPTLTDWNVHLAATHQSLYYKWIERAYLGGMRMMVEYIETTQVVCDVYKERLPSKSSDATCNEMVHVDHQLVKIKELQDYVDAQNGGPGKGWFRIVYTPAEAREVIKAGKLAVILGMEVDNPFDCFVNEREGFQACNDDMVRERLNKYYNKGVRALFPSHKFVNGFSSGDGDAGILELGDYRNTGHWRDYVACKDVPGDFLGGHGEGKERSLFNKLINVPGIQTLNNILSGDDAGTAKQALPIYPKAEAHCQRNGFTPIGFTLIDEMMSLGMIIDLGHTPKAAINDIIPVLLANDYPAVNTHGGDQAAANLIKGISTRGLGEACRDENGKSELNTSFKEIAEQMNPETGLPRKGMSYDFNGFAGYAHARFGELSKCELKQEDPLEYPFTSFAGDVVFEKLQTGERSYDFNTEGLANIGLFPDLIEEARRGGASDEEVADLFKTAESYIRIWEKSEQKKR